MKLCHIVPSLEEQHGGPSKSVRALCGALATNGHAVDLLTTSPQDLTPESTVGGVRVREFRRDWPQRICPSAGLRAALEATESEVIHHHSLWLRTLHYAHRRARRGPPLVISPRGMMSAWAWQHHGWRKQLSRRLVHPGALEATAGWHATSTEEASEIRALGFKQPICVSPNGVDAPTEPEIAAARAHWQQLCPAVTQRPVALFYSRFHRKKRVLELIDAWIATAPPDWLLLLVGIPQEYSPEMLESYAQKMSGGGRIRAFSGAGQPPPYPVASLFLLPSHNENFGLVIAEAMAHGVPVVVTDGTPWTAVNDDSRGWCVSWQDYGAALRTATAETPATLRERGQRARAWVVRDYSWTAAARRLGDFYRTLPSAA